MNLAKETEKLRFDLLNLREELCVADTKLEALTEKHTAVVDTLRHKDELLLATSTALREYKHRAGGDSKMQRLAEQLAAHQSQNAALLESVRPRRVP